MPTAQPKKILIAPLDWGLGHTTRCIPLIGYLRQLGHQAVFAGNAVQSALIRDAFKGSIIYIQLEGYNIRYRTSGFATYLSLLLQAVKIKSAIKAEHKWLLQYAANNHIDAVISDNRYGLHHAAISSVIITHQLQIQTGLGSLLNRLLQKIHYRYLQPFNQVWVPDTPAAPNLSGILGHPSIKPENTSYIGLLSQMADINTPAKEKGYLLILLSGPEPQRTILSGLLWKQVIDYAGDVVFVEGSNDAITTSSIPQHIQYYKRIDKDKAADLLMHAGMVICRSGYSTLMDLTALGKKAIVIPTPGQAEQQYLGRYLHKKGFFYCAKQKNFSLEKILEKIKSFPFINSNLRNHFNDYKEVIDRWLLTLK